MSSMDNNVVAAMFAALGQAQAGSAGMFRVDASSPNGIQGITFQGITFHLVHGQERDAPMASRASRSWPWTRWRICNTLSRR